MEASRPIGVFDSGIGGLTVASAIHRLLPEERIIYFGDTAHLPYGEKSHDAIRYFSLRISRFLLERDCKAIVVACNSASTAAYDVLLEFFEDKAVFVNVVDPLVKAALEVPHSKMGLIATHATVQSGVYEKLFSRADPNARLSCLATPLLVPMIEEGFVHNDISRSVLETYLSDPSLKDIDVLLLACTHYPLIRAEIESHYGGTVRVLDATEYTARALRNALADRNQLSAGKKEADHFYVSDYSENFARTTRLFYTENIVLERCNIWNDPT